MELKKAVLKLEWEVVETRIKRFIKDYMKKSGAQGIVLGISGGIDSCTISALSALAIGGDKVLGLLLPERETYRAEDIKHAKWVAQEFGFKTETVDITNTLKAFYGDIPLFDPQDKVCKGNIKARTRMIYLYYYANKLHRLVCGSSNKSEAMIGYFTKWGDVAADLSPIMDLYKTQTRNLAEHLGFPEGLVTKPASPTLWPGQKAETELGIDYGTLDLILYGLEHFMNSEEIANELEIDKEKVEKIEHRIVFMEHKRRMPLTTKNTYRTVGADFRLPRDISGK